MKKHTPLAAVIALFAAGLVAVLLARSTGTVPQAPAEALNVHQVSIILSNYVAEHGDPDLGPDANRDLVRQLINAKMLTPEYVTEGQILDRWGTPYAVFLCSGLGEFDGSLEINGQTVRPVQGAGRYLVHQVISAGPDREFGSGDDLCSWY